MSAEPDTFSRLLRRHRQAAALSQEALAERAALSIEAVSQLERGRRRKPHLETVHVLATALGLSTAERAAFITAARAAQDTTGSALETPASDGTPLYGRSHNLPAPTTALIGRAADVTGAVAVLERSAARLLTLTGVAGVGKTRLALEVARESMVRSAAYSDGAWLVDLAPLADPALVTSTVAAAVGLRETPERPLLDSLTAYLADKHLVLLLDNCEHLVVACAALAIVLLRACPHLRLLATSREALAIGEETLYRVPSLAFPDPSRLPPVAELLQYAAVTLLLERAQARGASVTLTGANALAVAQICARLDGIPLALELAAARLSALTVEQVAARLDDCFRLLTGGSRTALPRQQTLRATMDWSHGLLSAPEQVLLRRLAVFAGGWTLEAAEAVCADGAVPAGGRTPFDRVGGTPSSDIRLAPDAVLDLLAGLIGKSLVMLDSAPPTDRVPPVDAARYRVLETVRQYAQAQLEAAGERARVRDLHLTWFLALAEEGAAGLKSPAERAWLQRLEREHDNLRAALAWSVRDGTPARAEQRPRTPSPAGLQLAGALWWFWVLHGHVREGRRWLNAALAVDNTEADAARTRALIGAGYLARLQGDPRRAQQLLDESLRLAQANGDRAGRAEALDHLAVTAWDISDVPRAQQLWEESLALYRAQQDRLAIARTLRKLARIAINQPDGQGHSNDVGRAMPLLEESLRLTRLVGQPSGIAESLIWLGDAALDQGDLGRAHALLEESLTLVRGVGDNRLLVDALQRSGLLARQQGNVVLARALFEESLVLVRATGSPGMYRYALFLLCALAIEDGEAERAQALATEGLSLAQRGLPTVDLGNIAENVKVLAIATAATGPPLRAAHLFGALAALEEAYKPFMLWDFPAPALCESALAAARTGLDEETFATAWARGRAMTLEEIMAYALAPADGTAVSADHVVVGEDPALT